MHNLEIKIWEFFTQDEYFYMKWLAIGPILAFSSQTSLKNYKTDQKITTPAKIHFQCIAISLFIIGRGPDPHKVANS